MFTVKMAELAIGIDNKYDFVEKQSTGFLCDDEPIFTVCAYDDEIDAERKQSETDFSNGYLESIVVYRKIAERLPQYDAFVFHGAVIEYDGKAYAFTAKSGVGKTTHTRLWMKEFPDKTDYINGDKPIIRFIGTRPFAYGTPWRGKENYGSNKSGELCGIVFIDRATENSAFKAKTDEAVIKLMKQTYVPKEMSAAKQTMRLLNRLVSSVKLVDLRCNMDSSAAHTARQALISEND